MESAEPREGPTATDLDAQPKATPPRLQRPGAQSLPRRNSASQGDVDEDSPAWFTVHPNLYPHEEAQGEEAIDDDDSDIDKPPDRINSRSLSSPPPPPTPKDEGRVGWLFLPHKGQLLVLALCRLSEPLTQTSIVSYLYYLLEWMHDLNEPPPSASQISRQAGIMASSYAFAQCITGIFWGRLSDRIGRKPCLLIGLTGTAISVTCFGFSTKYPAALAFRILGGCLNGNVGVTRSTVTELVVEKKHQARAFLIMPMCFNIGIIIGPALGGLLADPANSFPGTFGNVEWMKKYPYALPNLLSAVFLTSSVILGFLFLDETLESKRNQRDIGREIGKALSRFVRRSYRRIRLLFTSKPAYEPIPDSPPDGEEHSETIRRTSEPARPAIKATPKRFRDAFTPSIITTLIAFAIIPLHNATFMHLYGIFLATPRSDGTHNGLKFNGGLGLTAQKVGFAMTIIGAIGIIFQIFLYPPIQQRLGLLKSFRLSLCLFPLAYFSIPFLALLPSTTPAPEPASGFWVWAGLTVVLGLQVTARTFALPGSVILLTNSVEDAGILGTVHGIGTSLASASRAVGPVAGAWGYAKGLDEGVVGAVFWSMAVVATLGAAWAARVREGKGIAGK